MFRAAILDKVAVADNIEFVLGRGSAHIVEELPIHIDAEADEVEEFLHVINVAQFVALFMAGGDKQVFHIVAHVSERRPKNWLLRKMLAQLAENPGITNAGATDH